MDVGAASALALYNYQTTLNSYSQGSSSASPSTGSPTSTASSAQDAAVLQALTNTYTSLTSSSNGLLDSTDSHSWMGGSGAVSALVSGMYSLSAANGNTGLPLSSLTASLASIGGVDASSASILFPTNGNNGLDGLSSAAVNLNSSLALASYANYQNGIPTGTLGADAAAAAAKTDTSQPANVQSALQAAQSATFNSTLNLLG